MKRKTPVQNKIEQLENGLQSVLPDYMPRDKAFYLDTRAKRIIKIEVVECVTKYSVTDTPDNSDSEIKISQIYEVKTSIGNIVVPEDKMIRSFKDASYRLATLLTD